MDWLRLGAALSLAVSGFGFSMRRHLPGRIALGFAVACLERIRENRLSAQVHSLLSQAPSTRPGRDA